MRFGNSWFIAEILSMPNKPDKIRVSLICGAIIGAVWAIPGLNLINCCCCAGVILGGVLAVYLYKQEFTEEMQPMESSDAVILGIMTGGVAAFAAMIFNLLLLALFGDVAGEMVRSIMASLIERMEESGSFPPEAIDQMKSEFERSMSQSRTVTGILTDLFLNLIINPLFAMGGALIGYSIFKPKKKIDTPQPQARQ